MTNFTELNAKEMNKVNGGSTVMGLLGPAITPILIYTLVKRIVK